MVSGGADAALREKRPYASPQASFAGLRCERARSRHKPIFRSGAFALPNHPLGAVLPEAGGHHHSARQTARSSVPVPHGRSRRREREAVFRRVAEHR
jgi:hypothetical protein